MNIRFMTTFLGLLVVIATDHVLAQGSTSSSPGNGKVRARPAPVPVPVPKSGVVSSFVVQSKTTHPGEGIDFVHAKGMELPALAPRSELQAHYDLMDALQGRPQRLNPGAFSPGAHGHGRMTPVNLGVPVISASDGDEISSQDYGTTNHPFATARADLDGTVTSNAYPYRAAGKLFFNIGNGSYICSASLIKRGVAVTAAHCVAEFGKNQLHSNWTFVPAYSNGVAPYGVWSAQSVYLLTSYLDGSDPCSTPGVSCQDDVALMLLNPDAAGNYPGSATGWYGYGYDGYGFSGSGLTQITQIGYPACLDSGALMERNDSYGYVSATQVNNTLIGSLMCGGSSGGPWLVNFGVAPALSGTTPGAAANSNVVVGVSSWGYTTNTLPKEMGSSPFTSGNIVTLVNAVCAAAPAACN